MTDSIGVIHAWWVGDALVPLRPVAALTVERAEQPVLLAEVCGLSATEIETRLAERHHLYVARMDHHPVAYGWCATQSASIGELGIDFTLPAANRYLWDFATLSAWRGNGFYPRLLQAILAAESSEADRFWIGHDAHNRASGRGIANAGFTQVGTLQHLDRRLTLHQDGSLERARAAAELLGVPLAISSPA